MVATLSCTVLWSCSAFQWASSTDEALPSSSARFPSADGRLYVTIQHSRNPFKVAIVERATGRSLGFAESSAVLSPDGKRLQGDVRVTYSDDLSVIVVHEDFSDASPNPRYILFKLCPGDGQYQASYFSPPVAHTNVPGEFDFLCPRIRHLTKDALTLGYEDGRTRVVPLSALNQTPQPGSFQDSRNE